MNSDEEILKRLNLISNTEWKQIIDSITTFVFFKIKGRTLFGAHSEKTLGMKAVDFYVGESLTKILSLEWKWQYEKYSIEEQLKRVAGSLISNNVEKEKIKKYNEIYIEDIEFEELEYIENQEWDDDIYNKFKEILEICSYGDEDLEFYVLALDECENFDELEKLTGFDKQKLYTLQRKITRRIKNYIETNKLKL